MSVMALEPISPPGDLADYPAPHLAVDLVLLTICDGELKVVMGRRDEEPFDGDLVLPGGFVHPGETLDETARRVMETKAGLRGLPVEQLYTFSTPGRDPRGWVVSAAYFALTPCDNLEDAVGKGPGLHLVTVRPKDVHDATLWLQGSEVDSGFDHHAIITTAVERLRGKLDWSMVAFALLPEKFTLFELQRIHEVILGHSLLKPPFRQKMLTRRFSDGRRLVGTGKLSRVGSHRPAELYALAPGAE
ncbi:MAG: NUDIX hydrolase, partial [Hyphomicrobiales bacterium]